MTKTALYGFLAVTTAALYILTHFTLNQSPSVPIGLYRWTHQSWDRGRLVLLKMPMKRIAALPGDQVTFTAQGIYRDGKLIPNTAPLPVHGLNHCPYGTYTVPKDFFLALGDVPDSWDGRYLCFLPESLISSTVDPLWTQGANNK